MYAVIEAGGRQYQVRPGQSIRVEKLSEDAGGPVVFDKILFISDGEKSKIGQPYVEGAKVTGSVVSQLRGDKIKIIKFKRRKHHMKRAGHRQYYTEVMVDSIEPSL